MESVGGVLRGGAGLSMLLQWLVLRRDQVLLGLAPKMALVVNF